MCTFSSTAIIPAYKDISGTLGISMQQVSYLTSLQIVITGAAPLFWKPLSNRYGRRPIFLLGVICGLVCNVGCAKSRSYAALAACSALMSFFMCPPTAMGSSVVTETFFQRDWAKCMGLWTIMLTLGVSTGPFIFGFVTYRVDYQWIYWTLAIVSTISAPTRRSLTFFFFFFLFSFGNRLMGSSLSYTCSEHQKRCALEKRVNTVALSGRLNTSPSDALIERPSVYMNLCSLCSW